MKKLHLALALVLGSLAVGGHAGPLPDQDFMFDCKMGSIENMRSDITEWTSKESTPFALFIEIDSTNKRNPVKGIKTVDPSRLMPPAKGNHIINHNWPTSIAVKIAPENDPMAATMGMATFKKLSTFATPAMKVEAGTTKAFILMANGALTDMDMSGQMGTCQILHGDDARAKFAELSK